MGYRTSRGPYGKNWFAAFAAVPDDGGTGWVRPADWPALPSPPVGTEAVVGLFAVNNTADERVAMTMSGGYTVNWGDGIIENFAAATVAEHNYVYANLTSPVTVAGYKTAIIQVTPQAGQNLTNVNITTPHTGAVPTSSKWLDIELRCPLATVLSTGSATALKPLVQRIWIREHGATLMNSNFRGCAALRSVPLFDTKNVTAMVSMFESTPALTAVPLFNTQSVTIMSAMFRSASALTTTPLFNTQNVANMTAMFQDASTLTTVPLFNTQNVTTMTAMFYNATALTAVPALNMQAITVASSNFIANSQVSSLLPYGARYTWDVKLAQLGAEALNTVFTNLATAASGSQTITITGNPGAATCNRSIATAKGWTVTG